MIRYRAGDVNLDFGSHRGYTIQKWLLHRRTAMFCEQTGCAVRHEIYFLLIDTPVNAYIVGMSDNSRTLPDRIVFIADAHLTKQDNDSERGRRLTTFLRRLRGRVSHLYIVGDLFDFWFEYSSVIPNTAPRVVFELYNLVQSGTKVVLFAGNHDYWLGPYLSREVGLDIELDSRTVTHQGLNLFLHHGDGIYPDDHGYRFLKKVLRNPLAISLFRLIHPDCAFWLARNTSKTSRNYLAPPGFDDKNRESFRKAGDAHLARGCDAVIFGHAHIPLIERRPGGSLIMLGDWIEHYSYILLEDGQFTLHSWEQEQAI